MMLTSCSDWLLNVITIIISHHLRGLEICCARGLENMPRLYMTTLVFVIVVTSNEKG